MKSEIEDDLTTLLDVPERLTNPVELVKLAKQSVDSSKKDRYLHDGLLINREGVKFSVTPANVPRALLFLDTLIKVIKKRGHTVERKSDELIFRVYTEEFKVALREKLKRVKVESKYSWDQYQRQPTGIFIFTANGWLNADMAYEDGKLPIENHISKIIAGIEIKSRAVAAERERIHKYWEDYREKERIEKERKQRIEDELIAFRNLIKQATRWKESQLVREYINDRKLKVIANNELTEELDKKFEWGLKKADWYDPTIEAKDDILSGSDREKVVQTEKSERRYS